MRLLKYFFFIAAFIMFAGASTHWAFAMLGCLCIGGVVGCQDIEIEDAKKRKILIDNDLYERMY